MGASATTDPAPQAEAGSLVSYVRAHDPRFPSWSHQSYTSLYVSEATGAFPALLEAIRALQRVGTGDEPERAANATRPPSEQVPRHGKEGLPELPTTCKP
jgi:hypothetical protein